MHTATYAFDSTWRPLLKDLGISGGNVLRRAGLPDDLLVRTAVRLPADDFHRFWRGLEAECGDPLLPLRVCQSVRSEAFSPVLFAALCSPNLQVAVQRVAQFKPLVAPIRLGILSGPHGLTVRLTWQDGISPPPESLVITELLFMVALARMGTRELVRPLRVASSATTKRAHPQFAAYTGVVLQRSCEHEVIFSAGDAQRPFLTANDGLWATFEPHLRQRLAALEASVTLGARVRAVLLEALPGGASDIDAVARRLAMSPRSLQRQLASEGSTYRALVRDTRIALAAHYLRETTIPVAEIALLLGFEETHSFHRAFRSWTGQTPERARREARIVSRA